MISPLVSLMVDQVCSLQARGICAAILSGNREQSAAGYREGHRPRQAYISLYYLANIV